MSLGVAFKGPEGIVLAADSRVTLTSEEDVKGKIVLLPSMFDNATKLLRMKGQDFVGVVTYGLGGIGQEEPRTAHSFLPEFEAELAQTQAKEDEKKNRLSVEDFARKLSDFFLRQWKDKMPEDYAGPDMVFLVGGFDKGAAYGSVYKIEIPSNPEPTEQSVGASFGVTWGGQLTHATRLIKGFDPRVPSAVQDYLKLSNEQTEKLQQYLEERFSSRIPYPFLPLQDCVDFSIFLIRTTMEFQNWTIGVRGVGGAIDVATITRTDGFQPIQYKKILGQREIV
jgi:hypothetical protein